MPLSSESMREFADFHREYLSDHIQLADAKAGVVLGVSGGIAGYLLSKPYFRDAITGTVGPYALLSWIALIALLLAFASAFAVILPRYSKAAPGPLYFHSVASYGDVSSYLADISDNTAESLARQMISNCYHVSVVCSRKYRVLRVSMWLCATAIAASGLNVMSLEL